MWRVGISKKAAKRLEKLTEPIQQKFDLLFKELEVAGPLRANWDNFGRLKGSHKDERYHCHIKKGRPTYVACWEVIKKR